jgi:hypothetical protein
MYSFLCLIKHFTMKAYGGVEVKLHTFLTQTQDGQKSASRPAHFT